MGFSVYVYVREDGEGPTFTFENREQNTAWNSMQKRHSCGLRVDRGRRMLKRGTRYCMSCGIWIYVGRSGEDGIREASLAN